MWKCFHNRKNVDNRDLILLDSGPCTKVGESIGDGYSETIDVVLDEEDIDTTVDSSDTKESSILENRIGRDYNTKLLESSISTLRLETNSSRRSEELKSSLRYRSRSGHAKSISVRFKDVQPTTEDLLNRAKALIANARKIGY